MVDSKEGAYECFLCGEEGLVVGFVFLLTLIEIDMRGKSSFIN